MSGCLTRTDGVVDLGELLDGRLVDVGALAGVDEQEQEVALVQQRFVGHHLAGFVDRLQGFREASVDLQHIDATLGPHTTA